MSPNEIASLSVAARSRIAEALVSGTIASGQTQFERGMGALQFADPPLAARFFGQAVPLIEHELAIPIPDVLPQNWDGVPRDRIPLIDRLTRSEWHGHLALCHWFLENRHDVESYRMVAEEMDRFLVLKEAEAATRSSNWREWFVRQFVAAGDFARLLKWMPDAPPLKKHQSGPLKMGWLLARHHVHGELTPAELDLAWKRFLDKHVPEWIERGSLLDLAVWMKVRYWDGESVKPDPYDAFLRFWDHLPGIERPPVIR